jgi:hypothetical protein
MNIGGTLVTSKICELAGKKFWVLTEAFDLCGTPGALLERHGAIYAALLHEVAVRETPQQTQIMLAPLVYAEHPLSRRAYSVSIRVDPFGGVSASAVPIGK